ncbi:MAG: hypothetical protein ACFBSD_05870 [Paracoccaceae bacterium]
METTQPDGSLGALVARTGAGDRAAFRALFEEAAPPLFGILVQMIGDMPRAEEALLRTFGDIRARAVSFDPERREPGPWLVQIARARGIEAVRRIRRREGPRDLAARPLPAGFGAAAPRGLATPGEGSVEYLALTDALGPLDDLARQVIARAYFDAASPEEIGRALDLTPRAVREEARDGIAEFVETLRDTGGRGRRKPKRSEIRAIERALGLAPRRGESDDDRRMRRRWEMRLTPLAEAVPAVEPPAGFMTAVEERERAARLVEERDAARRGRSAWQLAAVALIAVAVLGLSGLSNFVDRQQALVSLLDVFASHARNDRAAEISDAPARAEVTPEAPTPATGELTPQAPAPAAIAPENLVARVASDLDPLEIGLVVTRAGPEAPVLVVPVGVAALEPGYRLLIARRGEEGPLDLGPPPVSPITLSDLALGEGDLIRLEPGPDADPALPAFEGRMLRTEP